MQTPTRTIPRPQPDAPAVSPRRGRLVRFSTYAALALAVVLVMGMLAGSLYMRPAKASLDAELTYRLNELVGPGKPVRNVVLRVASGDGSLEWAGAAGIANQATGTAMTADTPIYIASVTKLFTATAVMHLYEQGALSLDDTIDRYLPADLINGIHVYKGHDYSREITIRQLLSHTSGLPDYYEDKAADGSSLFELLIQDPERNWSVDEMIARARDQMTPHFAPGTSAYYSDTNYLLLGKIIESVTGRPLESVYSELLFQPLGLTHTWLVARSEPQIPPAQPVADVFSGDLNIDRARSNPAFWADGGIVSTTEDMIAFLKALNTGGIVRPSTVQLMHSNWRQLENMPFEYGSGTEHFALPTPANSLRGLPSGALPGWASVASPAVWGHTGSVGSFLYYSEDRHVYVAGSVDQTQGGATTVMLMMRVISALDELQ